MEREYIEASEDLREDERRTMRRNNRRLRRLLAGAAAALVVALGGGLLAVTQQRSAERSSRRADDERRSAEVAQLAGTATGLASSRIAVASLLAVEAHRREPNATTLGALGDVLRAQPAIRRSLRLPFLSPGATLTSVSPDGRTGIFVTDGEVVAVAIPEFRERQRLPVSDATWAAFAP